MFAVITRILGACRFELLCDIGVVTGHIPGRRRRRVYINKGDGVEIEYVPDSRGRYKIIRVYGKELVSSSTFISANS